MKTCRVCKESKALEEFYKHPNTTDGRATICKRCQKSYVQGRYDRKRPVVPEGYKFCPRCKGVKLLAEFHKNKARSGGVQGHCKTCWLSYQRDYHKQDVPRWRASEKMNRRNKTPEGQLRLRARQLTGLAIQFGYLVRQPCEVCGIEKVVPHHTQYEKPLDGVRWLCEAHHLSHGHDGDWTKPPV